jgi:hypothetical protein
MCYIDRVMHLLYIQENWKTPKWPKYHQTQKIALFLKKKKKKKKSQSNCQALQRQAKPTQTNEPTTQKRYT